MEKNCFECRLKSYIKVTLDMLDFIFPSNKLNEEALNKKKEFRNLFLDNIHAIASANKLKKE